MQGLGVNLFFHRDSNCEWPLNEALSKKGAFYDKILEKKEKMGKNKKCYFTTGRNWGRLDKVRTVSLPELPIIW